jgi:hypothetical protein
MKGESPLGWTPIEAVAVKGGEEPGPAVTLSTAQLAARNMGEPDTSSHRNIGAVDPVMIEARTAGPGCKSFRIDQTGIAMPDAAFRRVWEIRPNRDEAIVPLVPRNGDCRHIGFITVALLALGLGWVGGSNFDRVFDPNRLQLADEAAINAVVEQIIHAESDGDPTAKNKRSSATGAGQFLDRTWVETIRVHRPDLVGGRSEKDILELRRDPELAREITTRFVKQNAMMLTKRGLPVTPGTLYLAHFAGAAGAVAILSVPGNADAASLIASADATGRMARDKIVGANPFLRDFTVADLKSWADRKMRGAGLPLVD